jgi:hypothetical protein
MDVPSLGNFNSQTECEQKREEEGREREREIILNA